MIFLQLCLYRNNIISINKNYIYKNLINRFNKKLLKNYNNINNNININ